MLEDGFAEHRRQYKAEWLTLKVHIASGSAQNCSRLLKNGRARMIQRHFGGLDLIFYNARSFAPRFGLTSQAVLSAEASR
jgi:hypothetical protein